EVNVCRNEQRVAALIGHGANPSHQVAHWADRVPVVRRPRVVRLAAEPGIIAFLLGLLLKREAGLGKAALLLLLLLLLGIILLRQVGLERAQGRRTVFGKKDIDAIRNIRGLGKFKLYPECAFSGLGGLI